MINQKSLHNKIYSGEAVIGHKKMKYVSRKFFYDMLQMAEIKPNEKVLDVGSGDGKFSNLYCNVISLDIAKQAHLHTNAPFVIGNILSLPFKSEMFEKIFCSEVIEHLPNQSYVKPAIKEIWYVLKPNGYAIISTPNQNSLIAFFRYIIKGYKEPAGSIHTSLISVYALKTICTACGFKIKKIHTYLFPLPIPKYDYVLPYYIMKILYHVGRVLPMSHGTIIKIQR